MHTYRQTSNASLDYLERGLSVYCLIEIVEFILLIDMDVGDDNSLIHFVRFELTICFLLTIMKRKRVK
jgi:hypothetical protein